MTEKMFNELTGVLAESELAYLPALDHLEVFKYTLKKGKEEKNDLLYISYSKDEEDKVDLYWIYKRRLFGRESVRHLKVDEEKLRWILFYVFKRTFKGEDPINVFNSFRTQAADGKIELNNGVTFLRVTPDLHETCKFVVNTGYVNSNKFNEIICTNAYYNKIRRSFGG